MILCDTSAGSVPSLVDNIIPIVIGATVTIIILLTTAVLLLIVFLIVLLYYKRNKVINHYIMSL